MVSTRTTRSIYGFVLLSAIAVSVYPVSGFINVAKQSNLRSIIHLQNLPYNRQRSRTTTSPTLCNSASDKSTDSGEKQDEKPSSSSEENFVTYYSPNVPLDQARYYNKDTDEDSTDLAGEIDPASSTNEYSFFDEAMIYVRGGSGGQGASTYKKGVGGQDGPPDGGNGGRGGNVLLIVDESLNTLAGLTNAWRPNSFGGSGAAASTTGPNSNNNSASRYKSFRAEHGMDGGRQQKSGRTGKDVMIRVPPGTVVQEVVSNEDNPMIDSTKELIDIGTLSVEEQPTLIVARGGEGGEGSAIGMKGGRGVRRVRIPPQGGDKKLLKLTLKIVADVALVGVPNAGKSTLLASVTRAKPKIANVSFIYSCCRHGMVRPSSLSHSLHYFFSIQYPFTTVIPNLGVWIPPESSDFGPAGSTTGSGSDGLVLCVSIPGFLASSYAEGFPLLVIFGFLMLSQSLCTSFMLFFNYLRRACDKKSGRPGFNCRSSKGGWLGPCLLATRRALSCHLTLSRCDFDRSDC